jgi:hypothetical protein
VFVPRSNANDLFEYWDLSDHFPVHGSIQWNQLSPLAYLL